MGACIFGQREDAGASSAAAPPLAAGNMGMAAMAAAGEATVEAARLGLREGAACTASASYLPWLGVFSLYSATRQRQRRHGAEFSATRPLFTKRVGTEYAISIFFLDQDAAGGFRPRHHRLSLGGRDRGILPIAAHDHRRVR